MRICWMWILFFYWNFSLRIRILHFLTFLVLYNLNFCFSYRVFFIKNRTDYIFRAILIFPQIKFIFWLQRACTFTCRLISNNLFSLNRLIVEICLISAIFFKLMLCQDILSIPYQSFFEGQIINSSFALISYYLFINCFESFLLEAICIFVIGQIFGGKNLILWR